MREIRMVDLKSQYLKIKQEIDSAIQNVIDSAYFVKATFLITLGHHMLLPAATEPMHCRSA